MEKKDYVKQVLVGIIGLVSSIVIVVLLMVFLPDTTSGFVRAAIFAVGISAVLAFLAYNMGGKVPAMVTIGGTVLCLAVYFTIKFLPSYIWIYLIVVVTVTLIIYLVIRSYRLDKEECSGMLTRKQIKERAKEEKKFKEEIYKSKQEIELGDHTLILYISSGTYYQLIAGENKLYFIRIGSELRGIDENLIKRDCAVGNNCLLGKKDFAINKKDIMQINCECAPSRESEPDGIGWISINACGKNRRFSVMGIPPFDKIEKVFEGYPVRMKQIKDLAYYDKSFSYREKKNLPKLKKTFLILSIICIIVSALFLITPRSPLYKLLLILSISLQIIFFILYAKNNTVVSIYPGKRGESPKMFQRSSINIWVLIVWPVMQITGISSADYNIMPNSNFVILSVILFAFMMLAFLIFTNEYKKVKFVFWMILCISVSLAPSIVVQVNCNFDYHVPVAKSCTIVDKHASSGRGSSYYLKVKAVNEKAFNANVSGKFYNKKNIGENVIINKSAGLLGISYIEVDTSK